MAKMTATIVKKSSSDGKKLAAAPLAKFKLGDTMDGFTIFDSEDGHYTVHGHTQSGKNVDISDVATLTASSSDTSVFTAPPPTGMSGIVVGVPAVPPATVDRNAILDLVATWNDGSLGPLTIDVTGTVKPSPLPPDPVTGLGVTFSAPTVH